MNIDAAVAQKITDAVTAAERDTAGEIVVVIAPHSSRYDGARAAFAVVVTTLTLLAAAVVWPGLHAVWSALAVPFVFLAAFLAAAAPPLTRALVPDDAEEEAVLHGARLAFIERGVHRTRDRSGVLVYISLLERRVHVVGDEGIHRIIGEAGWRSAVDRIVGALRAGKPEGIADVVTDMGATLARSFPRGADDTNELPDQVVVR